MTADKIPDVWAIVELMGHLTIAGKLTEEEKFGAKLGRVDVPQPDGTFFTQFFSGSSVYCISVVTEAVAREFGKARSAAPVQPWDFPKQIADKPMSPHKLFERLDDDDDEELRDENGNRY